MVLPSSIVGGPTIRISAAICYSRFRIINSSSGPNRGETLLPEEVEDPLTNSGSRKHLYALHGNVDWVTGFFYRLKPAVVTIVAEAVFRIGKKTLKNWILMGLAVAAFIAIDVFQVPPIAAGASSR